MTWYLSERICMMLIALSLLSASTRADAPPAPDEAQKLYAKEDWTAAAKLYERLTREQPAKGLYWYRLATCRLRLKEYKSALTAYEAALSHGAPEPQTRYNMACAYALMGDKDTALTSLEKSAAGGFAKAPLLRGDKDLVALHAEPRWQVLVDKLENPTKGLKGADAMDHWIGEWEVFVNGQLVGKNRIVKALHGFAVEEFWESRNGSLGRSLFVFEASKGAWKQLWTSDTGWVVEKVGTPIENGIYLEGTSRFANGTVKKSREYLTKNPDGSVRQLLEDWDESSKEWKATFDGKYVKSKDRTRYQDRTKD